MTDRKAMKMALDALINGKRVRSGEGGTKYQPDLEDAAIAALEAALAQTEQDWDLLAATQGSLREHQARIKELEAQLAQPEQAFVPFPSFMRNRIEQAMEDAINPKGMSVHDGKARVLASDLHRMLLIIDSAPPRKEWVGLSVNEARDFFESKLTRSELITEISEFLEEKNNAV